MTIVEVTIYMLRYMCLFVKHNTNQYKNMKKHCIFIFVVLFFTGCSMDIFGSGDRIVPVLICPPDGSKVPSDITLMWSVDSEYEYFSIQVARDKDFTKLVFQVDSIADCKYNIKNLARSQYYYWRVSVMYDYWSNPFAFYVL